MNRTIALAIRIREPTQSTHAKTAEEGVLNTHLEHEGDIFAIAKGGIKMAKFRFYGVYGFNGGGVYIDWGKCETAKPFISGFKVKGFRTKQEAIDYIVQGLVNVYHVCMFSEIDTDALSRHTNFFLYEKDLIRRQSMTAAPFSIRLNG